MKSHIIALAALAAVGFVGGAYAEDAKPKLAAPTVMSDSEMDKVTAGDPAIEFFTKGAGLVQTATGSADVSVDLPTPPETGSSGVTPGGGLLYTAPGPTP